MSHLRCNLLNVDKQCSSHLCRDLRIKKTSYPPPQTLNLQKWITIMDTPFQKGRKGEHVASLFHSNFEIHLGTSCRGLPPSGTVPWLGSSSALSESSSSPLFLVALVSILCIWLSHLRTFFSIRQGPSLHLSCFLCLISVYINFGV